MTPIPSRPARQFALQIQVAVLALAIAGLACIVSRPRPALVFTPDQLAAAQVGVPYSAVVTISQNVTPVFAVSAPNADLPPGLTVTGRADHQSALISGTPTRAGTYKFDLVALCYGTNVSGQTGTKTYTLVVQ